MNKRNISASLSLAFDLFPAVVLTGARQVGKTSLVRTLWPEATYLSLNDPAQAAAASLEPDGFLRGRPEPLILDDVHQAPELLPGLQRALEQGRRPGRFVVVGSPSSAIVASAAESLAGRAAVFSMPPLCLDEVFTQPRGDETAAFLWRGGFPPLWYDERLDRDLWLSSYVSAFLERDIRQAVNVSNRNGFDRFVRSAALRSGQLLSFTELARDAGISPNTAKRWLAVLEASQLVFLLQPYQRQRRKRLIRTPKLYFADTGLLCFLMGFRRATDLPGHGLWAAVWENFVVSEVRKRLLARATAPAMWFWRTAHGDQVDLLLEVGPGAFTAIVCRPAERPSVPDLKGVLRLAEEHGPAAIAHARIVCRTEESRPLNVPLDARAMPLSGPGGLLAELAG